ncbi:MAG: 7-carboxy-7-deazaguanine synthase [Pseudomonadota bacterium]
MGYWVKEIFTTLQGEGVHSGRVAVFCRFTGCNLWSGRESDRDMAQCRFCDTDFRGTDGPGGGQFKTAQALAEAVTARWPGGGAPWVVCTGGEPALQLDTPLVDALHRKGFEVAVETNGTRPLPAHLDWICVSPKGGTVLQVTRGDELKLVFPQPDVNPADFTALGFRHFILQPLDDAQRADHLRLAIAYCLAHPQWRLGLQTHKLIGIA